VPSYSRHIDRSRRSDGIVALLKIQLAQEQQRALRGAYSVDLPELGFERPLSYDGHYRLSVQLTDDDKWLAVATPRGAQKHDACARFAIDANGPVHTPPYAGRRCWNR
jgi:type IV pilus assembly protein PilE